MGILEIKDLSFSYSESDKKVLKKVNLSVEEGEFLVLCGVSGCGKSTLLRQLKPAIAPFGKREGTILLEDRDLWQMDDKAQTEAIGYVLQNPDQQIVTDKVWHELAFGLESLGMDQRTIRLRVAEMASYFGIEKMFHRRTDELSGGQKQLLNLASIMAINPKVLLLDEPTSQLDPIAAANFLSTVKKINQELGITVILTEHRLSELFALADRIALMDQGQIVACGTPKQLTAWIAEQKHVMYEALPAPARIYMELEGGMDCPLDVRDGRSWYHSYVRKHHMDVELLRKRCREIQDAQDDKDRSWGSGTKRKKPGAKSGDKKEAPILSCREVWFRYEREAPDILKGFDISINKGELYCLMGGNGTGKSTAATVLCGLYKPYRGKVFLKGKELKSYSDRELYQGMLGVVPQNPQCLFVKATVREELLEMLDADQERMEEIIRILNLGHLLEQHPYDLSGGEQQRLAVAKILLLAPEILLMDEPTKGLDCQRKRELAGIMAALKKRGITIVIVSHDVEFCAEHGDRCGMLFEGKLIAQGTAREFFAENCFYTTSANRMVRKVLPMAVTVQDVTGTKNVSDKRNS